MICTGPAPRQRLLVRPNVGAYGPTGTAEDLARWLRDARLEIERRELSGPFAYVTAVRSA